MPQMPQLLVKQPQTTNNTAIPAAGQASEPVENKGFSNVFRSQVSQAQKSSGQSAQDAPAADDKLSDKKADLANGNGLPDKNASSGELAADEVVTEEAVLKGFVEAEATQQGVPVTLNTPAAGVLDANLDVLDNKDALEIIETVQQSVVTETRTDPEEIISITAGHPEEGASELINARPVDAAQTVTTPLPSVVAQGQEQAVGNILKHQGADENVIVQQTAGSGREIPAQLAAQSRNPQTVILPDTEAQSVLDTEAEIEEGVPAQKEEGKLSAKLQDFVEQFKRALGIAPGNQKITPQHSASQQDPSISSTITAPSAATAGLSQQAGSTAITQTTASIDVPLKNAGWDESMAQRVLWMVNKNVQKVDVRLNPPNLGPMELRVNMTEKGAEITFVSQHGAVRETVESAIPKLREMLADQGVDLANVDVSEHSIAQHNSGHDTDGDGSSDHGQSENHAGTDDADNNGSVTTRVSEGLLDLFA